MKHTILFENLVRSDQSTHHTNTCRWWFIFKMLFCIIQNCQLNLSWTELCLYSCLTVALSRMWLLKKTLLYILLEIVKNSFNNLNKVYISDARFKNFSVCCLLLPKLHFWSSVHDWHLDLVLFSTIHCTYQGWEKYQSSKCCFLPTWWFKTVDSD